MNTARAFPITEHDIRALTDAVRSRLTAMVRELAGDDEIDDLAIEAETKRIVAKLRIGAPYSDSLHGALVHDAVVTAERMAGHGSRIALN